jgi:hypothetical protein
MSYEWYGILFLVIVIIVVIVVVIFVNRGNTLNIIDQLPNYKIFNQANNTYWGLTNVNPNIFNNPINYEFPAGVDFFWLPFATVKANADLDQWAIQTIKPNSFTQLEKNTRMVKIVNTGLFNANNNFGFLEVTPGPRYTLATASSLNAATFLYTDTGNNTFTLNLNNSHMNVNSNGYLVPTTLGEPTVFKLVPI